MRVLKTIVKVALSIGGIMLLGGAGDLFSTIFVFAAFYGLITYYMFSFANSDGFFVGDGLISMAFAIILNLGLPLVVIVAPMFLLEAILPVKSARSSTASLLSSRAWAVSSATSSIS